MWKILKIFLSKILYTPENYAKKIGVKVGDKCRIRTRNFGSEPYLISIGDRSNN